MLLVWWRAVLVCLAGHFLNELYLERLRILFVAAAAAAAT